MHHEFQTDNFADSFIGVWRRVITEPRAFFQDMPLSGGMQNPLIFLTISLAISALGFLIIGPRGFALWFVPAGLIRSLLGALVLMVVARQLFGGTGDYEATYRAVAYAGAPLALLWLPLVKPLVGLASLFLVILGLERVHGFDAVKSAVTVLLGLLVLAAVGRIIGPSFGHWLAIPLARV